MSMIIVRNSFTSRETRIRAKVGDVLTARRCRQIRSRLVAAECLSGGMLGERGPQDFAYEPFGWEGEVQITSIYEEV